MESIKDLIYFDYDKAKSLNSQLTGGIISELTRAIENEGGLASDVGFDIKILKSKVSGTSKERSVRTETIEIYHELLNQIETSLFDKRILNDLNARFKEDSNKSFNDFLLDVPNYTYIKATGWSSFEDYERFKRIMNNFNDIQRLIFTSVLENNPEVKQIKGQINEIKRGIKANPKANNQKEILRAKALEKNLDKTLEGNLNLILLDETFIEKVEIFLNTFSPDRLNFRLAPFDVFNDFQILANLKNEYLVNGSFENVIYTYGSRPNIKLSIFGIITSCPQKIDVRKDLNDEYLAYLEEELQDEVKFEKAFRHVFSTFENLEKFFFVPSYPKIAVSPIAIYREVRVP